MRYNLDNPLIVHNVQSLEKEEMKRSLFFNKLLKRNLRKIKKDCDSDKKKVNIICIGERIFY